MKQWFTLLFLVLMMPLVHAGFEEGVKYKRIANPQPPSATDKIEVLELFWYGCPHCYQIEPEVEVWLKSKPDDVGFVRMPAVLGPSWELLARAYYTADLLGATDKIHKPLFERLHKQGKTVVIVSHDFSLQDYSTRTIQISDGEMTEHEPVVLGVSHA